MNNAQQNRWLVDAALFTGFLTCFFVDLTGVPLHQWLGIAGGAVAAYHLVTHRHWIGDKTKRFFRRKLARLASLYYGLNAAILAGFIAMITTGLVISTWLDLALANYAAWRTAHILASIITLLAVTLKIALHGRWIIGVAKKVFHSRPAHAASGQKASIPVAESMDRRGFVKMMGVVGLAALFAFGNSIKSLASSTGPAEDTSASSLAGTTTSNTTLFTNPFSSSSSSCVLGCGRRCSYPGHCRRYVDSNGNGRCDLGECQG